MQAIIIEEKLPDILGISINDSVLENNSIAFYTGYLVVTESKLIDPYKNPDYQNRYSSCESFEQIMYHDQKCYGYDYCP